MSRRLTERSTVKTSPRGRTWNHGFIAFLATLVILALVSGYAVFIGGTQLAKQQLTSLFDGREEVSLIEVIIDGKPTLLRPETAVSLIPGLSARLNEGLPTVLAEVQEMIETSVDNAFDRALQQIPNFTTWYYSLRGEYTRYLEALTADLPGFMAQKLTEEVIAPSRLEDNLNGLQDRLDAELAERLQAESDWALDVLKALVTDASVPLETQEYRGEVQVSVELDKVVLDSLAVSEAEVVQKALTALAATGAGTAVAKGMGTVLVKKLVGKIMGTSGMKLAISLLGKVLLKVGVKSGGSAAAAAAGVTICAPGGLIAIGCGVIAAAVVWLLVDKAFIEMEEAMDRDAFEAEIRAVIIQEREALKRQLATAYEATIRQQYAKFVQQLVTNTPSSLHPQVDHDFVPSASTTDSGRTQ